MEPVQYVTVEMAEIYLMLSLLNCSIYCCCLWLLILSLQYRAPYMPPTQQYPVTSGTAGFYPGTSPAEYSAYGKGFWLRPTTTKHNHKHGGLSVKRGEISNTRTFNRDFKHVVLIHISWAPLYPWGIAGCVVVLLGWLVCYMSFWVKTLLCVVNCQLHVVWLDSALACVLSICSLTWHCLTGSMKWLFFSFCWMYIHINMLLRWDLMLGVT